MKLWKPEENFSKTFANPVIKKKKKLNYKKKVTYQGLGVRVMVKTIKQ